ncbi:MAG TPA: hypothetical protein VJL89_01290 [Thermodesulfovibrionia bacterium]|nr:hypothetical protein [Thermodesulfovibrionia bacterium]
MQETACESSIGKIAEHVNELKTIPPVAFKIVQLISNGKSTMSDFEALIRFDPVLTKVDPIVKTIFLKY